MENYDEELKKKSQVNEAGTTSQQMPRAGTQKSMSLAENTQANSAEVLSAKQYLDAIVRGETPKYQNSYAPQIKDLYDKVMNRGEFKYDVNNDPMYQQLRGAWENAGKMAMEDTIAQATGLSGGYGNSFAQATGQQQYNQHMQQFAGMLPEMRSQAYQEWMTQGDAMTNQLAMAQKLAAMEDERFRNEVSDLRNSQQMQMAQRESAFNQAMAMIQAGMTPGDDLMAMAGLTEADVAAYKQQLQGGSGNGSGKGNSLAGILQRGVIRGLNNYASALEGIVNAPDQTGAFGMLQNHVRNMASGKPTQANGQQAANDADAVIEEMRKLLK